MKNKLIVISTLIITLTACNNSTTKEVNDDATIGKSELTQEEKAHYLEKGKEIAQNTFMVLSSNLKQAMGEGGIEKAIAFCSVNAGVLTDSLSNYHQVTIKRTSQKTRNKRNLPTVTEQSVLDTYLKNGAEMKPIVTLLDNGDRAFYAPIVMLPLCVNCHGVVGENISNKNYEIIKNHYPNDEAINFKEGDLRGIWSITFKN
jgi:hypothetical protein